MVCEVGNKYGRLTVVKLIPHRKNPSAECLCDCGEKTITQRGALVSGKAQSCGCLRREKLREASTTHGMTTTQVYRVWRGMKDRCENQKNRQFHDYGGRGIRIEWESFSDFYTDMGDVPTGMMIERLDNNGNYCKANCVWTGWDAQTTNKRTSKVWVIFGIEYRSAKEAGIALGVDASTIYCRANGRHAKGKYYPPIEGYECVSRYRENQ